MTEISRLFQACMNHGISSEHSHNKCTQQFELDCVETFQQNGQKSLTDTWTLNIPMSHPDFVGGDNKASMNKQTPLTSEKIGTSTSPSPERPSPESTLKELAFE